MPANTTLEVCHRAARWLAAMVCGGGLMAQSLTAIEAPPRLTVHVYNYAHVAGPTLVRAQTVASWIFRTAGIDLSWAPCPVSVRDFEQSPARFTACVSSRGALVVRIVGGGSRRQFLPLRRVVGGIAVDDVVQVFDGSVEPVSGSHQLSPETLLGHVLAHELGHVLLRKNLHQAMGENTHSSSGIMAATLGRQEFGLMRRNCLLFNPEQAQRMRGRVEALAGVPVLTRAANSLPRGTSE